jgi:hypothetical protein
MIVEEDMHLQEQQYDKRSQMTTATTAAAAAAAPRPKPVSLQQPPLPRDSTPSVKNMPLCVVRTYVVLVHPVKEAIEVR